MYLNLIGYVAGIIGGLVAITISKDAYKEGCFTKLETFSSLVIVLVMIIFFIQRIIAIF